MTAQPLRLVSSATSGLGWHWLTSAAEMAALASGNWPLARDPAPLGWTCFPRIATRTPGTDPGSVSAAREFTVATMQQWGVPGRSDDVAIVVSELLSNALRHAMPTSAGTRPYSRIRLGLLQPGPCVICVVADPSHMAPVPREPDSLAESGRGLHVIGALSDKWGYTIPSTMGKVVWAMFSTRTGPAAAAPPAANGR